MNNFFILLLFGHLAGDYLFQPKWMALNKSKDGVTCHYHCLIYTFLVGIFTCKGMDYLMVIPWLGFIYATHFPIDRWSLADKWLALINGRTFNSFFKNNDTVDMRILDGSFTAIVYTVVDNTMHLGLMYFGYLLFFK